jgi:tetratricopeptide (TPR) repeat protein
MTLALADLRALVVGHTKAEGFDMFVLAAYSLMEAGLVKEALTVINEAFRRVSEVPSKSLAEGHNVRGQVLQHLGRLEEAKAEHGLTAQIGRQLEDPGVEGSAEFALGSVAQLSGDRSAARMHYANAFRLLHKANDVRAQVQIMLNLAQMRIEVEEFTEANDLIGSATEIVSKARDIRLRASLNGLQGNWYTKQRQHALAAKAYRASLRDARRAGAGNLMLQAMQNLGSAYADLGKPKLARQWYEKGIVVGETIGTAIQTIALHRGATVAAHMEGDISDARTHLETILQLAKASGQNLEAARAAVDLAGMSLASGDSERAKAFLDKARPAMKKDKSSAWVEAFWVHTIDVAARSKECLTKLERELGVALREVDPDVRVRLLRLAARLLAVRGFYERASELLRAALAFKLPGQDVQERAWQSAQAGAMLLELGGDGHAIAFFATAARIYSKVNDPQLVYKCRNDQANALAGATRYREALELHTECLVHGRRLKDRVLIAQACLNRGETLRRCRRLKEAIADLRKARRMYQDLGDTSGQASAAATLGLAWNDVGKRALAEQAFQQSASLARALSDDSSLAVALGGLADVARAAGNIRRAVSLYRRTVAIEASRGERLHEAETQAGLLLALSSLGDQRAAEQAVDRLFALTRGKDRPDLVSWALHEAGGIALDGQHTALAVELLAAAIVRPFANPIDLKTAFGDASSEVVDVIRRLYRWNPRRFSKLVARIRARVSKFSGRRLGKHLGAMLVAGEEAVHEMTERVTTGTTGVVPNTTKP